MCSCFHIFCVQASSVAVTPATRALPTAPPLTHAIQGVAFSFPRHTHSWATASHRYCMPQYVFLLPRFFFHISTFFYIFPHFRRVPWR